MFKTLLKINTAFLFIMSSVAEAQSASSAASSIASQVGSVVASAAVQQASSLSATSACANECVAWVPPNPIFIYSLIGIIFFLSLIGFKLIGIALSDTKWSLADAISEEVELTAMNPPDAAGHTTPVLDNAGKPITITEFRASASRLIAFVGMLVLLLMFIAFGIFTLFSFAFTGAMPRSVDDIVKFLLAGLTLFAPYAVNKFSSVFTNLVPKK